MGKNIKVKKPKPRRTSRPAKCSVNSIPTTVTPKKKSFLHRVASSCLTLALSITALFCLIILTLMIDLLITSDDAVAQGAPNYNEGHIYYYTLDHNGRPFNVRDESRTLRWYENHYPFGETIREETVNGPMVAGGGSYTVNWKPNFRFAGQFEDVDQFPFVQNHSREYLPEYGGYNRIDPKDSNFSTAYRYANNNPLTYSDFWGEDVELWRTRVYHSYVKIDQWDKNCCKKSGKASYGFGPKDLSSHGPGHVYHERDDSGSNLIFTCKCGCERSRAADLAARIYQQHPPEYDLFSFNCWHFSSVLLGICGCTGK